MKSLINRRGSKAATRAMKKFGRGSTPHPGKVPAKPPKHVIPINVNICESCDNVGLETMDKVAICNCCKNYDSYKPERTVA